MKAQKKLNIVLIVLIIVLISIASFIGVFYQDKNQMLDKIPDYTLGADIIGSRKIVLIVNGDDTSNTEELKTYENFIKSANIIKKRLSSMNVTDYTVRCDESTGQIEITLPDNNQTDYILADITQKGKFEIVDSISNDVLMDNKDIKSVSVRREQSAYSETETVSMDIKFNVKGTKKFKDITKNYQNVVLNEITNDTVSNEVSNEIEGEDTHNHEDGEEESTKKQVVLKLDGTSMMETTFDEIIENGIYTLGLGNSSSESSKVTEYQAKSLAAILENDDIPLQYVVSGNLYIASPIEQGSINILIYISIAIAIIILVITIIKYKTKGLAISLCGIGFIALYLIVLRYANVEISLTGILAIGLSFVINHIFNIMLLNKLENNLENAFINTLKKFSLTMIPMLILAVVCCFSGWMSIFSFGMVLFWGLIVSSVYNTIITRSLVDSMKK